MSALKTVASVLKARFNNLTVDETIDLAEQILQAIADEQSRKGVKACPWCLR